MTDKTVIYKFNKSKVDKLKTTFPEWGQFIKEVEELLYPFKDEITNIWFSFISSDGEIEEYVNTVNFLTHKNGLKIDMYSSWDEYTNAYVLFDSPRLRQIQTMATCVQSLVQGIEEEYLFQKVLNHVSNEKKNHNGGHFYLFSNGTHVFERTSSIK